MPIKPAASPYLKNLNAIAIALSLGLSGYAAITASKIEARLAQLDGGAFIPGIAPEDGAGDGYTEIPESDFIFNTQAGDQADEPVMSVFVDSRSAKLGDDDAFILPDGEVESLTPEAKARMLLLKGQMAYLESPAGEAEDDQGEVDTTTCSEASSESSESCVPLSDEGTLNNAVGKTSTDVMAELLVAAENAWVRPDTYVEGMHATVRVGIHRDGRITSVTIAKSSGDEAFDMSAKQAFKSLSPVSSVVDLDEGQREKLKSFTAAFKP